MEIRRLLTDLAGDLHNANILWQLGALLIALALAWGIAHVARLRLETPRGLGHEQAVIIRLALRGISRVLFPLSA